MLFWSQAATVGISDYPSTTFAASVNRRINPMLPDKLLSKRTVADILDVHPQTIMRLVRRGTFPPPLRTGDIGSAVRWREADVAGWIEQRTQRKVV
jgi:predicted DNA-binding transcriptional regulator AlpA